MKTILMLTGLFLISNVNCSAEEGRERKFRRAELDFFNYDMNGNLKIDEEEWTTFIADQREKARELLERSDEKRRKFDLDKDGLVSDEEIDEGVRIEFKDYFNRYLNSDLYKQRKAEYDKQHPGDASASE